MHDPTGSDILINGPKCVYVERRGKLERAPVQFRDLDHLLARHRELADGGTRVEREVHAREDRRRLLVQPRFVEEQPPAPARLAADEDVLRRRKVVHQVEFLMDDLDAQGLGGAR